MRQLVFSNHLRQKIFANWYQALKDSGILDNVEQLQGVFNGQSSPVVLEIKSRQKPKIKNI